MSLQEQQREILAVLAALGSVALLVQQAAALSQLPDADSILQTLLRRNLVQFDGIRYSLNHTLVETFRQEWNLTPWMEQALSYLTSWAEQHQQLPTQLLEETDALVQTLVQLAIDRGRKSLD